MRVEEVISGNVTVEVAVEWLTRFQLADTDDSISTSATASQALSFASDFLTAIRSSFRVVYSNKSRPQQVRPESQTPSRPAEPILEPVVSPVLPKPADLPAAAGAEVKKRDILDDFPMGVTKNMKVFRYPFPTPVAL